MVGPCWLPPTMPGEIVDMTAVDPVSEFDIALTTASVLGVPGFAPACCELFGEVEDVFFPEVGEDELPFLSGCEEDATDTFTSSLDLCEDVPSPEEGGCGSPPSPGGVISTA